MKLLLVAATEAEISPLLRHLEASWSTPVPGTFTRGNTRIRLCITGVGLMAATHALTRAATDDFQLAIQAGIAGAFTRSLTPGDVVVVEREWSDLGAEDHEAFIDVFELGFALPDAFPYSGGALVNGTLPDHFLPGLPRVSSLSVQTVSGRESTVQFRSSRWCCDIESMEGAAFHYVMLQAGIPFIQIRSISNYVEPRNRPSWKIGEAVRSLNDRLVRLIEDLDAAGGIPDEEVPGKTR